MSVRLQGLLEDFKTHHYAVIDLLDDEEELAKEQDIFDANEEQITELLIRLDKLIAISSATDTKLHSKRLNQLEEELTSITNGLSSISKFHDNTCILQHYDEQLESLKGEIAELRRKLQAMDIDESNKLYVLLTGIRKGAFEQSLKIRQLLYAQSNKATPGMRLPKIEVPTFDGNVLNWRSFWEQFQISVHSRTELSDTEKLIYLQNAIKTGTAKSTIEGLSDTGNHYDEAVKCLKSRYDKPRLIHQLHVRKLMEIPNVKDGHGKELRRLHDTAQQHLRALKAMGQEPSGSFITSMLELKLDPTTMFEWQHHSQDKAEVPHFEDLLSFIKLRAQASEAAATSHTGRKIVKADFHQLKKNPTSVTSFAATTDTKDNTCVACKSLEKHPLYLCTKFKMLSNADKFMLVKTNSLCINCLRPGHFTRNGKSTHKCCVCNKSHHTLLHVKPDKSISGNSANNVHDSTPVETISVPTHAIQCATMGSQSNVLLMTCVVTVKSPSGLTMEARALLDSGSSASFISERVAQSLSLERCKHRLCISGVACISSNSSTHSTTNFRVCSSHKPSREFDVTAIIVPRVTCDLPLRSICSTVDWNHLTGIRLADPNFATSGRIDLLLGVEIFTQVMRNGRRVGSPGIPDAFETHFGWVLAGGASVCPTTCVAANHACILSNEDNLLCKFWELEESPTPNMLLSPVEKAVVQQFQSQYYRSRTGRFVVPLPRKDDAKHLGESRSQAVNRFITFERSLHSKGHFLEFKAVIDEYFEMGHAEAIPRTDLEKPVHTTFYLPMHAVWKESSSTTKVRAVFDASAKTSTGVSLNDTLLVGPTVHPSLVDVLLRFRQHRVALTADVSRMYRALALTESDRDLHRFVWRCSPNDSLSERLSYD